MPQLSPMMGVVVFTLTNLSFLTVMLSVRGTMNISNLKHHLTVKNKGGFRGFS